jgi:5-dehydro-2-deoxygluconokinase
LSALTGGREPVRDFDLITMGRAILDVYGEQAGCRMEEVSSFAKYVGGCPANIAIGASRLGLRVAMITRVGDEQHGRFIREQLAREGVDVSHVRTDPKRATGVAFLAIRDKETFPLLHYRDDCADMAISPGDYSADFIGRARALLVSGSHLTTPDAAENIATAIERARARGTRVIFDIDYRPLFWGLTHRDFGESRFIESSVVTAASQRFLPFCDLVVGTEEEIRITGGSNDTLSALREIRNRTAATIVLKRGPQGCVAFAGAIPATIEAALVVPGFPVDVFNVVGAGDGFMGGLLFGWLRDRSLAEACRIGNACGALVVSRHGCAPASPTAQELEWFMRQSADRAPDLHRDRQLAHLHRATTRRFRPAALVIIDCDSPLAPGAGAHDSGRTAGEFKSLVVKALIEGRDQAPGLGIMLDHAEGEEALYRIGSSVDWISKRIDVPGCNPLMFDDGLPAGIALRHWPLHLIVKCSVPAATEVDRAVQDERLRELYLACQHYGHELLLDIGGVVGPDIAASIRALHTHEILPDWWRVPAQMVAAHGNALSDLVAETNPHCRGVIAQIDEEAPDAICGAIRTLPGLALFRGVSTGSRFLAKLSRRWLTGEATDTEVLEALRTRLIVIAGGILR